MKNLVFNFGDIHVRNIQAKLQLSSFNGVWEEEEVTDVRIDVTPLLPGTVLKFLTHCLLRKGGITEL